VNVTVDVDAPPEQVWRAAMDWERQGEWILATQVRVVDGDGESVGSKVEAVTGIGGLGVSDTFEIVEWEPPQRCVVRHTGRVVRGLGVFEVLPRNGCSLFSWTEELMLPLGVLGQLGWPVVRPAMRAGLDLSMRRFARFCAAYR
jgi:carbon monoxide dehydrogenase subunit G